MMLSPLFPFSITETWHSRLFVLGVVTMKKLFSIALGFALFLPNFGIILVSIIQISSWLKYGLMSSNSNIFSARIWWVCRHRNLSCLNHEVWSLNQLFFHINSSTKVMKNTLSKHGTVDTTKRFIRWNCYNHSCHILDVDGSCLGTPQRAGFIGLIRNSTGYYLSGFSGFIPNSEDILLAELSAIYHGLLLSRDMDIFEFVCYTDSLLCLNLITGPTMNYHIYAALIADIKDLLSSKNTSIFHTLWEGNQCADFFG